MNGGPYGTGSFKLLGRCGYRVDPKTGRFCENCSAELTGIDHKTVTALCCGRVIRTIHSVRQEDGFSLTLRNSDGTEVTYDRLHTLCAETGELVRIGDPLGAEGEQPIRLSVFREGYPIHATEFLGIPNAPGIYRPAAQKRQVGMALCPGDPVRIINPVRYGTGHRFQPYYDIYEVLGIRGDRVTVGAGGLAVAVLHRCDVSPL